MLTTNYLGPFLLTNLVLSAIKAAPSAKVIVVASEAHRLAGRFDPEDLADLGRYGRLRSFRAYGRTKLLDMLFAAELARRLEGTGVAVNSLCPGTVATGLYQSMPVLRALAPVLSRTPFVRSAEAGAEAIVKLATDPSLAKVTGQYFTSVPGLGRLPPVRARHDATVQRRVWERSAELVALKQ